jgi:hypothetical protein
LTLFNLNALRFGRLGLRQTDPEDSVLIGGLDLIGVNRRRQWKRVFETAIQPLDSVKLFVLHSPFEMALATDAENIVLDADVDHRLLPAICAGCFRTIGFIRS